MLPDFNSLETPQISKISIKTDGCEVNGTHSLICSGLSSSSFEVVDAFSSVEDMIAWVGDVLENPLGFETSGRADVENDRTAVELDYLELNPRSAKEKRSFDLQEQADWKLR